MTEFLGELSL